MTPESISHLQFRKSSYSSSHGQNCVEVADTAGASLVRDSQHPDHGHLAFPSAEWRAFLEGLDEL
ncbi:DUF397 domain-containing protein [Streptomonospora sp. PA3]|uniref:DUF397 domain-containing protein n=1 Tax=Streptomonospora sp. PA3 TaxID=2607326 RepID=UPI0012DEE0D0|nr:DUF397 domain-containing protein [Streptomonospora sp. PA3]MUL39650.1 DUF397 domain-containing protein [Streptomonospora sp. PA3]